LTTTMNGPYTLYCHGWISISILRQGEDDFLWHVMILLRCRVRQSWWLDNHSMLEFDVFVDATAVHVRRPTDCASAAASAPHQKALKSPGSRARSGRLHARVGPRRFHASESQ